jgi:hypothetical protein
MLEIVPLSVQHERMNRPGVTVTCDDAGRCYTQQMRIGALGDVELKWPRLNTSGERDPHTRVSRSNIGYHEIGTHVPWLWATIGHR